MSILDGFFGSKRDIVWQRLADEVGGNYFEGGLSPGESKVRARVDLSERKLRRQASFGRYGNWIGSR